MIKAEWINNDALSTGQTTHSNAHNTLNALDCVSRQYAIEHYQHVCRRTACKECPLHIQVTDTLTDCELELFLHNLPSAQPTIEPRAKGKWDFIGDNMFMCTSCGAIYTTQQLKCLKQHVTDSDLPPYCPNCGADMREEDDNEP